MLFPGIFVVEYFLSHHSISWHKLVYFFPIIGKRKSTSNFQIIAQYSLLYLPNNNPQHNHTYADIFPIVPSVRHPI